jgi:hypothetical protein
MMNPLKIKITVYMSVSQPGYAENDHGFRWKWWSKYINILKYSESPKYPSKYLGNICPLIGSTGLISLPYQLPFCFLVC